MKRFLLSALLFVLLLAVLGGCGGRKVIDVSDQQNGEKIQMTAGQTIVITLESNPTTGYSWELTDYDKSLLAAQGEPEFKSKSKLVGAGGVEIFRLEAKKVGDTELHMVYHRPWEKDVPPVKEFQLNISVKE